MSTLTSTKPIPAPICNTCRYWNAMASTLVRGVVTSTCINAVSPNANNPTSKFASCDKHKE